MSLLFDEGPASRDAGLVETPKPLTVRAAESSRFRRFYLAVVLIQGVHVVEHLIQLAQVHIFDVADDDALGLLGYVFQFNGTEEWLHLVFNSMYVVSLYLVLIGVLGLYRLGILSWSATVVFIVFGVVFESWHLVEHGVIISNVIRNNGCPCPGIGDVALGVSDTNLHFGYNAIAYAATLMPLSLLYPRAQRWSRGRQL
jgi:hypothetical protein